MEKSDSPVLKVPTQRSESKKSRGVTARQWRFIVENYEPLAAENRIVVYAKTRNDGTSGGFTAKTSGPRRRVSTVFLAARKVIPLLLIAVVNYCVRPSAKTHHLHYRIPFRFVNGCCRCCWLEMDANKGSFGEDGHCGEPDRNKTNRAKRKRETTNQYN